MIDSNRHRAFIRQMPRQVTTVQMQSMNDMDTG